MVIQAAQVSLDIDAPPDFVWKALTTREVLGSSFFGSKVDTDWKVGSPILFRGEWKGKAFEDKGQIQVFSPPKQLRFTHWSPLSGVPDEPRNYHIATFDLAPSGTKTRVTVTQENEDGKPVEPATREELAKNWTAILDGLKKAVEKMRPGSH
jgi:uncharacterized protein YndB with AHSA1/START domain